MKFLDNLAVTTCLNEIPQEHNIQLLAADNTTILKKRSHRLMSLIKKQGGGSQISQTAPSVSQSCLQTAAIQTNAVSRNGFQSEQIEKSLGIGKTTRKYNMRQPRQSRTRNTFDATKGVNTNDEFFQLRGKDTTVATSPILRKQSTSMRESKETLPPRTIDESHEDQIIRLLEIHQRQRLEQDPIRELDEALMDRTTASLNRRQKITSFKANTIFVEEVANQIASFVIRDSCSYVPPKGAEMETVSEGSSSQVLNSNNSDEQQNLNQYQIGEDIKVLKEIELTKQNRNKLFNTLELESADSATGQGINLHDFQKLQLDQLNLKRSKNLDTCSTNVTGQMGLEYNISDPLNDNLLLNKRNLKSYQKKPKLTYDIKNESMLRPRNSVAIVTSTKSQKIDKTQGGFVQIVNIQNNLDLESKEINYWKEEQKVLSSQDNLPHIQLQNNTPQQFYAQLKTGDQNMDQQFLKPVILGQNKNEWITNRSKQDMYLMNQFIRPLPLFDQKGVSFLSLNPITSKNLIKSHSLEKKKKNKSKFKQSRKNRDYLEDQKFRSLTIKMVGLSNMISLMNATGQSKAFTDKCQSQKMCGTASENGYDQYENSTYQNYDQEGFQNQNAQIPKGPQVNKQYEFQHPDESMMAWTDPKVQVNVSSKKARR